MSDFENAKEYGANDNPCMKQSQETQLGGDGMALLTTPSFGEGSKGLVEAQQLLRHHTLTLTFLSVQNLSPPQSTLKAPLRQRRQNG